VCDYYEWREASIDEEIRCRTNAECQGEKTCKDGRNGKFDERDGIIYVCDYEWDGWRVANCAEIATGSLCTANDTALLVEACEKVGGFDIDYVCSRGPWHAVHTPFEYTLAQWTAKRNAYNAAAVDAALNSDSMITDPRDGNTYRTVVINGMRVFAENLRYADSVASINLKGQTRCHKNETKNCAIGGRYYTWTAALDLDSKKWQSSSASSLIGDQHQGICPDGWHVPNNAEWNALFSGVGFAAQQMTGYDEWTAATNASGFSALPADGSGAYFWSATDGGLYADHWRLHADDAYLYGYQSKDNGIAIRCIQDYPTEP